MTECPYKKIKLELASCENEQYVSVEKLEDPEEQDENEEMEEVAQPIVNGNHLQVFHVLDETDGDSDNPENDEGKAWLIIKIPLIT